MKILSLKCPQCGASLDSENASFCSYCGARLYLDDGSKNININYKNEDIAKIREIEVNRELELNKRQEETRNMRRIGVICSLACLAMVGIIVFAMFMAKNEANRNKEKELQGIVNEIYADMDTGNYEKALIKAKSIYYVGDKAKKEKWDDTREALIKIIEQKMK